MGAQPRFKITVVVIQSSLCVCAPAAASPLQSLLLASRIVCACVCVCVRACEGVGGGDRVGMGWDGGGRLRPASRAITGSRYPVIPVPGAERGRGRWAAAGRTHRRTTRGSGSLQSVHGTRSQRLSLSLYLSLSLSLCSLSISLVHVDMCVWSRVLFFSFFFLGLCVCQCRALLQRQGQLDG